MDFSLTDEQRMIIKTTRDFVRNELVPHEQEVERTGVLSKELYHELRAKAIEAGLYAANMPAEVGGAGLDTVTAEIGERPAPAIETIAYFCAAELIANATKHSYANQIKINIFSERAGLLRLEVADDGIGGAEAAHGTGLTGLAQRVSTVDGHIDVSSPAGGPTKVTVQLPLRAGGDG